MIRRSWAKTGLWLCAAVWPVAWPAFCHAAPVSCPATTGYEEQAEPMPHVAAAVRAGALSILAVGSGSLATPVSGPGDLSFPDRMADALRQDRPGLRVDLAVRGWRGLTADRMVPIIRKHMAGAAAKHAPVQLVVWQTGTVEAVRNIPPGDLYETILDGVDAIRGAGADVVIVDPQYSGFLQANTDLDAYEQSLEQAAALPGITVFHRRDLMRGWAESDAIDLEHTDGPERDRQEARLHGCLGQFLARLILRGAAAP